MKDILSTPDACLHTTVDVAEFLGRTPRAIRNLVRTKVLIPSDKRCTMYFSTAEIRRYITTAKLFKDNKGVPPEHLKGPTDADQSA